MTRVGRALLVCGCLTAVIACASGRPARSDSPRPLPRDSALVTPVRPRVALVQCSRHGSPEFERLWSPTAAEIRTMESRFSRLLRVESEHCCVLGGRIERMETYRLQYVGLVVAGRKLVYVNAFCSAPPPAWDSTALVDACDGGPCYWGALYDPETGRFSELAFNGIGG